MSQPRRSPALLLFAALSLPGCGADAPPGGGRAAGSFLLVTLDTTRADRLAPYGAAVETPALAGLAEAGALFERAFATTPVTLPSHASIFTGLYPPAHGVRLNGLHRLPAELPTLAELLAEAGFRTAAFLSSAVLDRRFGLARGFELYDDDMTAGPPRAPGFHAERRADRTVDAARAWLDRLAPGERFFLWVHLFDPHAVFAPPPPFAERYRDRPYEGEIAFMDAEIGRLLEHPRLAGAPELLVMAIADHGEGLGEHGEANHGMLAYDATLRVPWIVRGPGVAAGRRLAAPVSQVDLLPTALELLAVDGAAPGPELQGASLAARLRGAATGEPPAGAAERALYGETLVPLYSYGWAPLRVVWRGDWKLIQAPTPELFDLAEDPGEAINLAPRRPRQAGALERDLAALSRPGSRPAETVPADAELERQLRGLGYLAAQAPAATAAPRPDPKEMIDLHRLMGQAGQRLARGELEPAVELLGEVLRRDPANPAAAADLARALELLGRLAEARATLEDALSRHPENPRLHRALAGVAAAGGELEEALAALDRALELEPTSTETRVERARCLARLGRSGEASAALAEALADDPDHARLNVAYAQLVEASAGRLAAAADRLRGVTRRDPYLAEGWIVLGELLERREREEEALAAYREGRRFQPADGLLHARLGLLLVQRGEDAAAETHLRQAVSRLASAPPELFVALATTAIRRRDWPAADRAARQALERDPERPAAWNVLAAAREEQGDDDEALAAYRRALEIDPAFTPALLNQGLALRRLRRWAEAEASFLALLERQPGDPKAHYELGVLYGGPLARPEEARRHLRASLAADPDHPRAARLRALLEQLGG